jgi:hypothetical protein
MRRSRPQLVLATLMTAASLSAAASEIDYGRAEAWLARPGLPSAATHVPKGSGYSSLEAAARADVFYVHPTTGMRTDIENVPIDDEQALATGRLMLGAQATPFNGIARIYAPRYRQAALHVFDRDETALQAPADAAYADVRRAFDHYAAHDNGGRPFFLVSHSQGSNHAMRLLIEAIRGTPMAARLVAAYLPGQPTPRAVFAGPLLSIPPCAAPEQTGCVALWGVFADSYRDFGGWEAINVYWDADTRRWRSARGMPLVNVNPVSWREDDAPVPASQHRGAVPFGVAATHFTAPVARLVGARTGHGYTLVAPPLPAGLFDGGGVFEPGNYHVFDISLFWADLRANARRRLAAFLARFGATYPLIAGPVTATATAGRPFRLRLATRNAPTSFRAEGLPAGLRLDAATGEITGTPAAPGVHAVVVTAANAAGATTDELALTVDAGLR